MSRPFFYVLSFMRSFSAATRDQLTALSTYLCRLMTREEFGVKLNDEK